MTKLSYCSSPLPNLPPPQNNAEAESRKRPPCHSNRSVNGMCHRICREVSRDKRYSELAPNNMPPRHGGMDPPLPFIYPIIGAPPSSYLVSFTAVKGPEDMLSSPLGQHILSYEPPRDFAIPRFITEIKYSEWLANVVVVPKKGGKWRVCIDYIDLKDACPKDSFPLPHIDQIVDASSGHGMLSFLDAFSGYHQIPMYPPDVEKASFITPHGLFCYNVMPFWLKNDGATYQRLVTKMFRPLLGKTMEVYIDDMLVKSKECLDHATHLQEAFDFLKAYDMKLNPLKCTFRVSADRFLGFMVT